MAEELLHQRWITFFKSYERKRELYIEGDATTDELNKLGRRIQHIFPPLSQIFNGIPIGEEEVIKLPKERRTIVIAELIARFNSLQLRPSYTTAFGLEQRMIDYENWLIWFAETRIKFDNN